MDYAKQSGSLLQEKNTSALLSSIEEKRGNSKEAFNWYKNYISISDIIVEEQKSVTQVETNHLINTSIDKSRTKIKVQNQVKNILLAVVLILVFGISIGLLGKLIKAL